MSGRCETAVRKVRDGNPLDAWRESTRSETGCPEDIRQDFLKVRAGSPQGTRRKSSRCKTELRNVRNGSPQSAILESARFKTGDRIVRDEMSARYQAGCSEGVRGQSATYETEVRMVQEGSQQDARRDVRKLPDKCKA